jgi:Xaa-Pro aminopeptidase
MICKRPVEAGNVFTLELHVQVPEQDMMSLAEDVLVTEEGVQHLSHPQTELRYSR